MMRDDCSPKPFMRQHLNAYLSELAGTAIMMAIGVGAIALLWAPESPLPRIEPDRLRLLATGLIFAGGATLVVYSPLGRMSGGHLNPAVTCAFWRLGRIDSRDAVVYAIAQTAGALAGVEAVRLVAGNLGTAVELGMTRPGMGISPLVACLFEMLITFALMLLILTFLNRPTLAPRTGIAAGSLVALLVMLEAPLTGTSLNPARSLAPALLMGRLDGVWIYLVAPPIGALLAAAAWRGRWGARQALICAKLYHGGASPCQFVTCPYVTLRAGDVVIRENEPGDTAYVIEAGEVEVPREAVGATHDVRLPWPELQRRQPDQADIILGRLGPGQWFGEMSVLLGEPRSATIVAITDGRARRLTREAFEQALADDPAHALALMRQLAERVRDTDRRLAAPLAP
jgi:aquaporin Z